MARRKRPLIKPDMSREEVAAVLGGNKLEDSIQTEVVGFLRNLGYFAEENHRSIHKQAAKILREAGWFSSPVRQTVGASDLKISAPWWPTGVWIAIELKNATGKLRPEQKVLHDAGRTFVARSVQEVIDLIKAVEEKNGWKRGASMK